jgi:hypothetical protein
MCRVNPFLIPVLSSDTWQSLPHSAARVEGAPHEKNDIITRAIAPVIIEKRNEKLEKFSTGIQAM